MSKHRDDSFGRSDQYQNPLDQLHKLSGHKQEAHHKLVSGIIKEMKFKDDEISDITRLHMEGMRRCQLIRQYAQAIAQGHFESGKELDRNHLLAEINTKFLDAFHHYNKDQLLMMFCMMQTEITMKEVV